MKQIIIPLSVIFFLCACSNISTTDISLEPSMYNENFETNELSAWASYPFWQDVAFDPNMRVGTIVPGDTNLSVVEKVIPYTNVDYYAGAQKKLDMYLAAGSYVKLRYYLKTQLSPEFLKIRIAAGPDGKVDYTIKNPETNKWIWVEANYSDFIDENPGVENERIKVNALAVFAKFTQSDPAMNIYFGLDDVELKGLKKTSFKFSIPEMEKLSEWKPFIPKRHFEKGDTFVLKGTWQFSADKVSLQVAPFTEKGNTFLSKDLSRNGNEWSTEFELTFPEGLYLANLEAYKDGEKLSTTQFTIFTKPASLGGVHPRLWFDKKNQGKVAAKLKSAKYKNVKDEIVANAKKYREENPVGKLAFDIDQFPGADIDPVFGGQNLVPWGKQIIGWRKGVYYNALAYKLLGSRQSGEYVKNLMVKISSYPFWVHPWWKERGQHIYYPIGELGMSLALGYDLVYDLMNEQEREEVRSALRTQIVEACHKGYVEDDLVTCNTSNWVAHITGGSMMCQAAMYGEDESIENEPYFTGVILKAYDLIQKTVGKDGSWGEGYVYYDFTMLSLSKTLPAMDNVFNIDMSKKLVGSYKDLVWAGNIKDKKPYYFGDAAENFVNPLTNFAWLLAKHKEPLLGWFYNYLKKEETFMDVLYDTENVPRKAPFDKNPVKFFRDIGTTVFKSGWEKDGFIFVMRTGAFYNHQHLDQGTFWLSDGGSLFLGERHGSTYYLDPYYNSWYTQPVAHSTILIDHNNQSQRVGDPLVFADGFSDHAFIYHYLDGSNAAFSSGDIGKVYWGKVKQMSRNVLYLKPRTVLMIDVIKPTERDVDVTLLYQTERLEDIAAGKHKSTISREGSVLHINHLYPEKLESNTVETPHYIYTFRQERPLIKEGMLTVTARTQGKPLVMANLLTTTKETNEGVEYSDNGGCISGVTNGNNFIFSTSPDNLYNCNDFTTDALALTWDEEKIFAAVVKSLNKEGKLVISSGIPLTCEVSKGTIKYYHGKQADVTIGLQSKPSKVLLNGNVVTGWRYDGDRQNMKIELPEGEGLLVID